jgi:type 1 glutamine amidotransferase
MIRIALALLCLVAATTGQSADRKILLISGAPSHGKLEHEHRAGLLLFQKALASIPGVVTELHSNGWVRAESAFDGADAIVLYSSGGGGNPFLKDDRLEILGKLMKRGVGLGCIHYAVEPKNDTGETEFVDWIGGAFETDYSVNPFWTPNFAPLPKHPVTRGVKPFSIEDEWYYHMRFRDGMKGVTPILSAVPPLSTLSRPNGPHEGNASVRAAVANHEPQTVMWVAEREGGGRGFGFTGGHKHLNWGNDSQRKLVLNAILWIAHAEVPPDGVESHVTDAELHANLDPK